MRLPSVQPAPLDPELLARMRRVERWLIPASLVGLFVVIALAWYAVRITTVQIRNDNNLTLDEARYFVRSQKLIHKTITDARALIPEAQFTPAQDDLTEGAITADTDALAPINDTPGAMLRLDITSGVINQARLQLP
jgi:hypothetical protein